MENQEWVLHQPWGCCPSVLTPFPSTDTHGRARGHQVLLHTMSRLQEPGPVLQWQWEEPSFPLWDGVSHCGMEFPTMGWSFPLWDQVPHLPSHP